MSTLLVMPRAVPQSALRRPVLAARLSIPSLSAARHLHRIQSRPLRPMPASWRLPRLPRLPQSTLAHHKALSMLPLARTFHTSQPTRAPVIPLPYFLILLKSGNFLSLISLSFKGALTFLPHSIINKYSRRTKILIAIPTIGLIILIIVGLDRAPNTGRWRLVYLSDEEERDKVSSEVNQLLQSQFGLIVPKEHELTLWAQRIIDNLSVAAQDDIRSPVRHYTPEDRESARPYTLNILCDASTLNAVCYGQTILLYDLMIQFMDYDEHMIAAILAHEISHSIQRHFVEQHGFASLLFILADIGRGILWPITEVLGPYVNEKLNDIIRDYITLETRNTYNRKLEKEADLIGLLIMAKAGYNPEAAVRVWERMALLEEEVGADASRAGEVASVEVEERHPAVVARSPNHTHHLVATRALAAAAAVANSQQIARSYADSKVGEEEEQSSLNAQSLVETLLTVWFGGTHPPSAERVAYMRENLDEAKRVYRESLERNGPPGSHRINLQRLEQQELMRTGGRSRSGNGQELDRTWWDWAFGWWKGDVPGVEVGATA